MAGKMDSNNKDVNMMMLRIKAIMDSRSKGNELFKAAKYSEAIDEALEASQMAGKMDSNNKDVNTMLLRIKAIMDSRSKGNELFKAAKYSEACVAYGEGLYNDSFNFVLLCNRPACRTKLGQLKKATDDCDMH
ncbi:tetratricopeptide repeat (TPR)-like superfamily protein [Artemisia annua]|uniref:Tetratricopeptide repeat (TPR)-like superfamily protein n=1 Tax=Artemisia annua TaxID=35608 RepID=A0A2U1KIU3_ARTAN|nr:tetratricopeptide repeat (TPR)-like superfamily protein [Artemisia annua]